MVYGFRVMIARRLAGRGTRCRAIVSDRRRSNPNGEDGADDMAVSEDPTGFGLMPMSQIGAIGACPHFAAGTADAYKLLGSWVKSYLMVSHPELGRSGAVCPFTPQAFRLDTIRIGVCDATSLDRASVLAGMRRCFQEFKQIPCSASMKHFRTVIVGFPKLGDAAGLETLAAVQGRLKFHSLLRGLMVGLFHASTDAPGLWNPEFRPLRSPIPVLAIRHLVANDAPFAARHPLLVPSYVARYPVAGSKKLLAQFVRRFG